MQLTENQKIILSKILGDLPNKIYVFGSRARNTARPDSDLDLCIFPVKGSPISLTRMALLREAFENSKLPFVVDLVAFNNLPDSFQKKVLSEGQVFLL